VINVICENYLCRYWKDDECILDSICLDIMGCCKECICVDIDKDILEVFRKKDLENEEK